MPNDLLQHIRDLQYTNRGEAEALLLGFLKEVYRPDVTSVEIRTLAISLNSFNGFLTLANGESFFFKSHTETDTVIGEYYQAELLDQAGYPIIKPIFRSSDPGKQILIYERIQQPAVFDVAWAIESGNQNINQDALQNAQIKSPNVLLEEHNRVESFHLLETCKRTQLLKTQNLEILEYEPPGLPTEEGIGICSAIANRGILQYNI